MSNVLIRPSSGILEFNAGLAGGSGLQSLTGAARLTYDSFGGINLLSYASGTTGLDRFSVEGAQGKLFTITDQISGSLFSINDIGGLPILEVFDNNTIIAGGFNTKDFIISGNKIGIGGYPATGATGYKLYISGDINIDGEVRTSGLVLATSNALNASGSNLTNTINSFSGTFNQSGISLKNDITNLANSTDKFLRLDSTTQSIVGDKTFLGNVVIQNLTVTGTQSIASSSDLTIASNYIVINSGDQGGNGISLLSGGLRIDRGTGAAYPDAIFQYNENEKRFEFGVEGSLSGIAPIETLNTTISNLATTGNTLSNSISLMSGSFNNSGTNVINNINSLSGSLNTSGGNLISSINSLSGALNQSGINLSINISNVQTNLNLTGANLTELLRTGYLNLTSNQEITGVKNFITPPTINGLEIVTSNNIGDQINLVLQTGNQTISGIKTFTSPLFAPNLVYNTGNQIISGIKTFQSQPTLNGAPLLVSGTYGSVDIETARVNITNGSIEQNIRFLKTYGVNTKPIVVSNLYYTGLNDEIIAHQIQNVTSTGFTVSLSRPATGYSVNYWAMENTGASFLALGATTSIFAQRDNLQTGTTSQFINFTNTSLVNPPVLNLTLEDRNPTPTENFFLFKATGINRTGFFLYLSEPIPSGHTGYFLHTQVTP
jgi:hypothetical protein